MIELDFSAASLAPASTFGFMFWGDELLLKEETGTLTVPSIAELKTSKVLIKFSQYIGSLEKKACHTGSLETKDLPDGYVLKKLRPLYSELDENCFCMALRAFHLLTWLQNNQYCGRCGNNMEASEEELAQKCSICSHIAYPRISPAIIVAITKGSQILLARSNRFPPGRYSVIAGFVEAGETLEDCVKREIFEEVGITATNIRYFSSQPWPYPDSLMIGFTAQWAAGDIQIDNKEIVAADWFSADNLPDIPGPESLGRKLIDWFLTSQK